MSPFGNYVRSKREQAGITLTEFAKRLDISPAYWSRIETGRESPPKEDLIKEAARILEVTEDAYDAMVEAARQKLADAKASTTAKLPGSAKFVRILPHPDGLHAVIVRVPGGMDARKYIAELRDAPDDPNMRMDANVLSFESRLLWPSVGTQEYVDLVDLFALAHRMVYPSELQKLAGFTGIDVKKKG